MPRKQIEWGTNEEFILKYKELESSRKMGEYYNCDKSSVLNHAKKIGYDVKSNKEYKLSEQDKKDIIKAYSTTSSNILAKQYNVSRGMITKLWYDANLKGKQVINQSSSIDLTGQVFGKWTVLYKTEKRSVNGGVYWHCKCECSQEKDVLSQSLRMGRSISCGNHSNISKGNVKIAEILDKNGIDYEIEKNLQLV